MASQAVAMVPDSTAVATRVALLFMLERLDDAIALADSFLATDSSSVAGRGWRGVLAAAAGDRQIALELERWFAAQHPTYGRGDLTMWRARIEAQLGNADRAVQLLRQAYTEGAAFMLYHHADPLLEPLRADAAFKEFVRPKG